MQAWVDFEPPTLEQTHRLAFEVGLRRVRELPPAVIAAYMETAGLLARRHDDGER